MNILEHIGIAVAKSSNYFFKVSDWVKEKTGKSIVDKMTEAREKDERLKEENPALWATKKLAKGAIKGITGSTLSHD